ncbi:alpha/beta hydrolase [Paenibacillus sp. NRS-1760]|uniref:alpha/beta hydrolase n=1 Tax=Paenibacillus sp. NRS-1760 TaxID=3233902 RepID=UPI003D2B018B
MEKTSIEQLTAIKQFLKQTSNFSEMPVEKIRNEMNNTAAAMQMNTDIIVQEVVIGNLYGEWITPANVTVDANKVILYFHGGGFIAGTCAFYRDLTARIAKSSGVKVLVIEYRLAPEHSYPAANEDCLTAYRWLLENGYSPANILFGGDSVGGSLALMTLLSLRDQGEMLPAGAFLISPHTDLVHLDGESYTTRSELDPTGSLEGNRRILNTYLGSSTDDILLLSPLRMNLSGLPDLFIQVGDHEVLLSDSTRFTDQARAAGVAVTLEVWDQMWSVFHFLAYMLPEAQQAIDHIGHFVKKKLP